jgi:hypothetical protein
MILDKLSNIEGELKRNNTLIVEYMGTYKEQKLNELRDIMLKGHKNNQMGMLQEIVDIFKEILNDKENVEKELEKIKEEAEF